MGAVDFKMIYSFSLIFLMLPSDFFNRLVKKYSFPASSVLLRGGPLREQAAVRLARRSKEHDVTEEKQICKNIRQSLQNRLTAKTETTPAMQEFKFANTLTPWDTPDRSLFL